MVIERELTRSRDAKPQREFLTIDKCGDLPWIYFYWKCDNTKKLTKA